MKHHRHREDCRRDRGLLAILPVVAWLAGCSNDLPAPGACPIPAGADPVVTQVPLVGHAVTFDDLRYSPRLGKVIAAPEGVGRMYTVDPETLEVMTITSTGGTASADADERIIYAADRGTDSVVAFDATSGARVASVNLDGN